MLGSFNTLRRFFLEGMNHPQLLPNLDSIDNAESIPSVT